MTERIIANSSVTGRPIELALGRRLPCYVAIELAWAAQIPLGCEGAVTGGRSARGEATATVPLTGRTVAEGLEEIVAMYPDYAWTDDDGVIVVRPRLPRRDREVFFGQVIDARTFGSHGGVVEAFQILAGTFGWRRLAGHAGGEPFEVHFSGGTVVAFMNATARGRKDMVWHVTDLVPGFEEPLKRGLYVEFLVSGGGGIGAVLPPTSF